jgi:hypothetical protein
MKVAVYVRVSTQRQALIQTIERASPTLVRAQSDAGVDVARGEYFSG